DYISTSFGSDNLAHGVFSTATAPTSGTNCSSVLDNCREPTDSFISGLAAGGPLSSDGDPVLFGGNHKGGASLWNVVDNNGSKHPDYLFASPVRAAGECQRLSAHCCAGVQADQTRASRTPVQPNSPLWAAFLPPAAWGLEGVGRLPFISPVRSTGEAP